LLWHLKDPFSDGQAENNHSNPYDTVVRNIFEHCRVDRSLGF